MEDNCELLFENDSIFEENKEEARACDLENNNYSPEYRDNWKIMIVDDEPEVHRITKLVLSKFTFEGKGLNILSAYSGREAKECIKSNTDTALILLDVVMEEDDAGLKLVKYIREELKNKLVRIILRTGQPGQAPEDRIIIDYDINDYKDKTELTSQKLFTELVSSLRAYRDLSVIETNRLGLSNILDSYEEIFMLDNIKDYTYSMLRKLSNILGSSKRHSSEQPSGFAAIKTNDEFYILSGVGKFANEIDKIAKTAVQADILEDLQTANNIRANIFREDRMIVFLKSKLGTDSLIYFEDYDRLSLLNKSLIEVFCKNLSVVNEAIINRSKYETEKEQRQLAEMLYDFNQNITSTFEIKEVLDILNNELFKIVQCNASEIILKRNNDYILYTAAGVSKYEGNKIISKSSYEAGVIRILEDKRAPLLIEDVHNYIYLLKDGSCEDEMCSLLALPILHKDEVLGVVLLWGNEPKAFRRREKDIALTLISQAVAALVNAKLFNEVENRRAAIKNLLNNAGQGFLSFGEDLLIDSEYSYECERIFGVKLEQLNITELLFASREERAFWENAILSVFYEQNESKRDIIISLLCRELVINGLCIELEYKLIQYESSMKMMIILTDVTHKRMLESEVENERRTLQMVVNVVKQHEDFVNSVKDFEIFCNFAIKEILHSSQTVEDAVLEMFRSVHTYKGIFSQLGIVNLTSKLHEFESFLQGIKREAKLTSISELKELIEQKQILSWLDEDLQVLSNILGRQFMHQDKIITLKQTALMQIEDKIMKLNSSKEHVEILMDIRRLRYKPFREMLSNIPEYFIRTAEREGKLIKSFEIAGGYFLVDTNRYSSFAKSLIHVFRNAVDHGLESCEERLNLNKEESGTITCSIDLEDENIIVAIADDGKGIDIEKIKECAVKKEIYTEAELQDIDDDKFLMLIFEADFSVSQKPLDFSGRGYGLSAVKNEVDKLGGAITVKTIPNRGTALYFQIPFRQE